jgi:thioesterase domain-containing protein
MVAFEMARQLETGGDSVELLAIFDTRRGDFGDGITKWGRLKAAAQNFRHLSGSQRLRYLWVKAHDAFIEWFAPRGVSALSRNRGQDYSHAYTAARSYVQQPYGGKVVLFRADQGLEAYRADRLDWREMARGGVDFVTVSGNHDDMLSPPHIDAIASVLKNRLKWPAVHARTDESRR